MAGRSSPPVLAPARVHEVSGPGARAFALMAAAPHPGRLVWIEPAHFPERLMPWGVAPFLSPSRLLILRCRTETDLLWSVEESLRSGAAGFVVAAPQKPLSLTAGRRLQLAAEAGRTTGLLMIREGEGSNAAETRWRAAPVFDPGGDGERAVHQWDLVKNKSGRIGGWRVSWNEAARAVDVPPPVAARGPHRTEAAQ